MVQVLWTWGDDCLRLRGWADRSGLRPHRIETPSLKTWATRPNNDWRQCNPQSTVVNRKSAIDKARTTAVTVFTGPDGGQTAHYVLR